MFSSWTLALSIWRRLLDSGCGAKRSNSDGKENMRAKVNTRKRGRFISKGEFFKYAGVNASAHVNPWQCHFKMRRRKGYPSYFGHLSNIKLALSPVDTRAHERSGISPFTLCPSKGIIRLRFFSRASTWLNWETTRKLGEPGVKRNVILISKATEKKSEDKLN